MPASITEGKIMARLKIKTLEPVALKNTEKAKEMIARFRSLLEVFESRFEVIEEGGLAFRLDLSIHATYERVQEILVTLRLLAQNAKTAQKIVVIVDAKNATLWVGPPATIVAAQKAENYKTAMEAVVRLTEAQRVKLVAELELVKS